MTSIELNNPSAFYPLKIYSQTRARNVIDKAPAVQLPKRRTREELEKIGNETVAVASRGTAIVNGAPQTVTRDVPTPAYKVAGFETLNEFITDNSEREGRAYEKAVADAAMRPSSRERTVDSWGALLPMQSVPPGDKAVINVEENRRLAIQCDEAVTLQVSNTDKNRTLRLRSLDIATNEHAHVAFLAPAREYPQAAIVSANGKTAAVIELQPL